MYALEAKIRTEDARTTRDQGLIPGVLYGKDVPSTKVSFGVSEFIKVYREAGNSQIITVTLDGKKYNTLVGEAQQHPVRGNILHIDLINIDMNRALEIQIPIILTGTSPAVIEGGQLHQSLSKLTVKCLPKDIVESFTLDVSTLTMGHSLHVSDLSIDTKKFTLVTPETETIVSAHALKNLEEETEVTEEVTAETEEASTTETNTPATE